MKEFEKLRDSFYLLENLKSALMLQLVKMDEEQWKYRKASVYPLPEVEELSLPVHTEKGEQVFLIFRLEYVGALPPYFESTKKNSHDSYRKLLRAYYETGTELAIRMNRVVPTYEQSVIYFKHHFEDLSIRDLDNRNRKLIIDALRHNQVIGDDNWMECSIYEEGVLATRNYIEVFVMEQAALPHFLLQRATNR